jgi:hypothetical protein
METAPVPPPKRGGTFFYCPWEVCERNRAGGVTVHSCADGSRHGVAVPARFRREASCRRHYRRAHGPVAAPAAVPVLTGWRDELAVFQASAGPGGVVFPMTPAELRSESIRERINRTLRRRA